jgi:hypothetical protein
MYYCKTWTRNLTQLWKLFYLLPQMQKDVTVLKDGVETAKADIKIIKAVVTDTSRELQAHAHRLDKLEASS